MSKNKKISNNHFLLLLLILNFSINRNKLLLEKANQYIFIRNEALCESIFEFERLNHCLNHLFITFILLQYGHEYNVEAVENWNNLANI